jgi:hypothetical protein
MPSLRTENDICLLCDLSKSFVKKGFTCEHTPIKNCTVQTSAKTCLKCDSGLYFNSTQNKCLPVETNRTNCVSYDFQQKCIKCENDYYVDSNNTGNCVSVEVPISECDTYESSSVCSKCNQDFLLDQNKTKCISMIPLKDCKFYSQMLSCTSCVENSNLNRNKYLLDLVKDQAFMSSFYQLWMHNLDNQQFLNSSYSVCLPKIQNCQKETPENRCVECLDGYFLFNNNCVENPKERIPNCRTYTNAVTCESCNHMFFLSANTCKPIKLVENCLQYSNTVDQTCLLCSPFFYLSFGKCFKRSVQIANCKLYATSSEECAQCYQGFIVSFDSKYCVTEIINCLETNSISPIPGKYSSICYECEKQYFVQTTTLANGELKTECLLPSQIIEGCSTYQSNVNCKECSQGYYFANFKCIKQNQEIAKKINCKAQSVTLPDICLTCDLLEFKFKLINHCSSVDEAKIKPNCVLYGGSDGKCIECGSEFYLESLDNQLTCKRTNIPSCLKVDTNSNKCLNCNSQSGLMPSVNRIENSCISIPNNFNLNCKTFETDITQDITNCQSCFAPFYALKFSSVFYQFCYGFAEFQNIGDKFSQSDIDNLSACLSFDLKTKSCLMCDPDSLTSLVSSTHRNCTQSCNWGNEVVLTFSLDTTYPDSYFRCFAIPRLHMDGDSSTNCKRADYTVSSSVHIENEAKIKQFCAECLENFIPVLDSINKMEYSHFDYLPMATFKNSISSISYFSPLIKRALFTLCRPWNAEFLFKNAMQLDPLNLPKDSSLVTLISYTITIGYLGRNWNDFSNCRVLISETFESSLRFGCLSCHFQHTGPIVTSTGSNNFIYWCKKMDSCDTRVYYAGIGSHDINSHLDLHVSCHKCLNSTLIVTISRLKPWTLPSTANQFTRKLNEDRDVTGHWDATSCMLRGIIKENDNGLFPTNCAVQQVVPSEKLQGYTSSLSVPPNPVCVACLPMYKPRLSINNIIDENYKFIAACTLITNCEKSSIFNACEQCKINFVLKVNLAAPGLSMFDECVASTIQFCLIGEPDGKCVLCQKGFVLNSYGFCDDLKVNKCSRAGKRRTFFDCI